MFLLNLKQITPDDKLPKIVCSFCVSKMEDFYSFIDVSLKQTDKMLTELWNDSETITSGMDFESYRNRYMRSYIPAEPHVSLKAVNVPKSFKITVYYI